MAGSQWLDYKDRYFSQDQDESRVHCRQV